MRADHPVQFSWDCRQEPSLEATARCVVWVYFNNIPPLASSPTQEAMAINLLNGPEIAGMSSANHGRQAVEGTTFTPLRQKPGTPAAPNQ